MNKKNKHILIAEAIVDTEEVTAAMRFPKNFRKYVLSMIGKRNAYMGGLSLVLATFIANFLNYVFNAFLGRILSFEDFALIGLIGGLLSFASILFGSYATTVNYQSSYLIGKYGENAATVFWKHILRKIVLPSIVITGLWLALIPFFMQFFHTTNVYLFLLFGVVLLVGFVSNINQGFLASKMKFGSLAVLSLTDPLTKLGATILLVLLGLKLWAFATIPTAAFVVFVVAWILLLKQLPKKITYSGNAQVKKFSKRFFFVTLLSGFSNVAYFTFDILLAKHFLSPAQAGEYALVSLVGKMVFFLGNLTAPFIIPFIARYEGAQKDTLKALYILVGITALLSFVGFLLLGVFGFITVPFLYGSKALTIVPYLLFFTFGMMCYTISTVWISYYLVRKIYTFPILTFFIVLLQIGLISLFHDNVKAIVIDMTVVLLINLLVTLILHNRVRQVKQFEKYFTGLVQTYFKKNTMVGFIYNKRK